LGILRGAAEAAQWSPESYSGLANSPGGVILACEVEGDGLLIGFVAARKLSGEAEILNIAVHPDFRRKGVASALLLATLDEFRHSAVSRVFLELRESNFSARSLYERSGFVSAGRRTGYYSQPTEDALCMQLTLLSV
jgi:ribosomal-protein-alanine N-acetyltransferase